MVNTSQEINKSYGYLWWLNGKESLIPPAITIPIEVSLASNAPEDLIAGMVKTANILTLFQVKILL